MAAGLISKEDFLKKASDICRRSQLLDDGWILEQIGDDMVLCKTVTQQIACSLKTSQTSDYQIHQEADTEAGVEDTDDACLTVDTNPVSETLRFEYHVVYSESYSVPVLYVNVTKADGQLVSLTQLWDLIPSAYRDRLEEDKWTFFTQQEHPLLGRPFYQLHPCHTEKLMSNFGLPDEGAHQEDSKRNYLITWLSTVGPVVHLNIPLDYGKLT